MPARGSDPVELTDLNVIRRWSLAVRGGTAERADLIEALRDDLAWLQSGAASRRSTAASGREGSEPDAEPDAGTEAAAPRRRRPRAGVRVSRRG